jgi:hypothetical protein
MIPFWIVAILIIISIGITVWERWEYKKLYNYVETLEHFLDMYITQYGTLPGITEVSSEDIDANNT